MSRISGWQQYSMLLAPPDELLCSCSDRKSLILGKIANYSYPTSCFSCGGQIDPCSLLEPYLCAPLGRWATVHRAILDLSMDVGDYADWADGELGDPWSSVHRNGLQLVNAIREAGYSCCLWIQRPSEGDWAACPRCGGSVHRYSYLRWEVVMCDRCWIVSAHAR